MTIFVLILVLVAGSLWYLSTMNAERPLTRMEKTIPNDQLGK